MMVHVQNKLDTISDKSAKSSHDIMFNKERLLREYLLKKLSKNITDIVLFGSTAREERTLDSDIDLLVVLNKSNSVYLLQEACNIFREDIKVEPLTKYCSTPYDKSNHKIHLLYCSDNDLLNDSPIINNVKHDGISLI